MILALIFFLPFVSAAQEDDAHQELLRMQFVLTGARAPLTLHQRLKGAASSQDELKKIEEETLQSPEFVDLMVHRVREMFRLKESLAVYQQESFDLIVKDVVQNDLSWDLLFVGKKTPFNLYNEGDFFSGLLPEEAGRGRSDDSSVKDLKDYVQSLDQEKKIDQGVSGLITTSDFFERYPTTKLNKNRKRAAALFRTLLCDDMNPVFLPSAEEDQSLLNESLGLNQEAPQMSDHARHGNQKDCNACHFKLDPAGETFRGTGSRLNSEEVPGALALKDKDGNLVHVDVRSLPELIQAMVKRPEYVSCQVRHFWDWTIGSNVPLSAQAEKELTQKFEEVGHRPKEFLKYMIARPEFAHPPLLRESEEIRFANVKPILDRCTKCHDNEFYIPSFNQLPIGFAGDQKEHQEWIGKIVKMLDLNGDGTQAKMPPQRANWKLTAEQREALRAWIKYGAADDKGVATVDRDLGRKLIPQEINQDLLIGKTQFGYTYARYLNGFDFVRSLSQQLNRLQSDSMYNYFYELGELNKQRPIGISSPATGDLAFRVLNPEVFSSYSQFLEKFQGDLEISVQRIFPEMQQYYFGPWESVPTSAKANIIAGLVDLLRPELIESPQKRADVYAKLYRLMDLPQFSKLAFTKVLNLSAAKLVFSKEYLTVGGFR